jgi:hypothetical protein
MRLLPMLFVTLLLLPPAGVAHAQEPCAPDFAVGRPDPVGVETITTLRPSAKGAERVEVEWGDGARSVEPADDDGDALALHRFARPGPVVTTLVAVCAGERRSEPIRLELQVLPPCGERRGRTILQPDCDDARGSLIVSDVGGQAPADWLDAPCRDALRVDVVRPPGDQPRARAADCVLPTRRPLAGPLYTYRGSRVTLEFEAPVRGVTVYALGRGLRPVRIGGALAAGPRGHTWRFRIPRGVSRRLDRLAMTAYRAGVVDRYLIGLRLMRR